MAGRSKDPEVKARKLAEYHRRAKEIRDAIATGLLPPEAKFHRNRKASIDLLAVRQPERPVVSVAMAPHGASGFGAYSRFLPADPVKNLEARRFLLGKARADIRFRGALREMCSRDMLFWANFAGFVYEPRNTGRNPKVVPFLAWDFQVDVLRELCGALGSQDRLIEKSRDMGATWMCLLVFAHSFLFHPWRSFLLVSHRKEDVSSTGNPDTLFWKLHFLLKMQPRFLLGTFDLEKHSRSLHLWHPDTNCTIDGTSTTQDAGRGGRRTAILLDEFAMCVDGWEMATSTSGTTNCRFFNSTPGPTGLDAFYGLVRKGMILRIRIHWSRHPLKSPGLYIGPKGEIRSPWYDAEEKRATDLRRFHREHDIDYEEAAATVFSIVEIERMVTHDASEPTGCYQLEQEPDGRPALVPSHSGQIRCWVPIQNGAPLSGRDYGIGVDVSNGTGSSNSCFSVSDRQTGEKVAEWACSTVTASEWGRLGALLGRCFSGHSGEALMIWEGNGGAGRNFGDALLAEGYSRVWRRVSPAGQVSDRPGWVSTPVEKEVLLKGYNDALLSRRYINRSRAALLECKQYLYTGAGRIEHSAEYFAKGTKSGYGGHGDMVIADALSCMVSKLKPISSQGNPMEAPEIIPESCFYRRLKVSVAEGEERGTEHW